MNWQPICRSGLDGVTAARPPAMAALVVLLVAAGFSTARGGVVRYIAINDDSDSQVDAAKTYTHLWDFGTGTPAANINGVQFNQGTIADVDADPGISYTVSSGARSDHGGNASHNVGGNLVDLMTDMIYNGGNAPNGTATFALSNLAPGKYYDARIYVRSWGGGGGGRTSNITFDPDGAGPETNTVTLQQDGALPNPPGFADGNQAYILSYQFQATASDITIEFEQLGSNVSWHQYGLTNEEVERPIIPTLYSTGVDDSRAMVVAGTPDPHWELTSAPGGFTEALKIDPHPAWAGVQPEDGNSGWIGPANPGTTGVPPGVYTYETTFDLTGFFFDTAELTVAIAADDGVDAVLLNGNPVSFTVGGWTVNNPFTINSGFVYGINRLEFLVRNSGTSNNPHGVRIEILGTAEVVPEPGSIALLGLGGLALAGFAWRRRKRAR